MYRPKGVPLRVCPALGVPLRVCPALGVPQGVGYPPWVYLRLWENVSRSWAHLWENVSRSWAHLWENNHRFGKNVRDKSPF